MSNLFGNTNNNSYNLAISRLLDVHMNSAIQDEQVKQIPKAVEAAKAINKGQIQIIEDLVESSKKFTMEELIKAQMTKGLLGAGDLAGLAKIMS